MKKSHYMRTITTTVIISAFAFIALMAGNAFAQQAGVKQISLEELWRNAGEKSPSIQARLKDVEAIEYKIKSLQKPYLPSINADLGYSGAANLNEFEHGPLARLTAEWILWDGGRTMASKKILTLSSGSVGLQGAIFAIEVKKKIAAVYYDTARLEASVADEKKKLNNLVSLKKLLMPRLKIGKIGYSDVEDMVIRIEDTAGKIKNDELVIDYKKRQLRLLTGGDAEDPLYIPGFSVLKGVGPEIAAIKTTLTSPALILARRQTALLEAKKEHRERELYWPVFGIELYGGYGPHRDAIDPHKPEVGAGAVFRVPIIIGGSRSAEMKSLTAEIDAAKLDLARMEKDNKAAADYIMKAIPAMDDRMDSLEKSVKRAEKNLTAAFNEFSRGLKSPADMITALQYLYELKSKYHDAKMEFLALKAELFLTYGNDGLSTYDSIKN
ncbi:MAG TPA: TolC family protein [Spirochaetota bacterium]|nr:TolC family protein [Spirochaetota bacterium]